MGSLSITLVVFVLASSVMHILVWRKVGRKKFWLIIDYIWLGVAAMALIGATADVRKTFSRNKLSLAEIYLSATKDRALDCARSEATYFVGVDFSQWKYNLDRIPQYQQAAEWYTTAANALEQGETSDAWRDFMHERFNEDLGDDPVIVQSKRSMAMFIRHMDDAKADVEQLHTDTGSTEFEDIRLALYPWLLAVALAIRISKVSAGLRGLT